MTVHSNESANWAERLGEVIPWGSSTCSKAARLMPEEPGVIVRGKGCRVWDADGREFIDFRNALGPVTLGYAYPAVNAAIREQMDSGIVFGHPHPIEGEVAELIREIIPCAEKVRFLKTGGEASAACIRLARHHTKRDHIVQIGYNGWLNSLAGSRGSDPAHPSFSAPPGVPAAVSALHHACPWNDLPAVEELFEQRGRDIAAVVVASAYENTEDGKAFYSSLRDITRQHGALLIFDEIVTGFRVAIAGVQEYFGVVPDLAVFAKGMANGMPISTYLGAAEVMEGLHQAIVSSTYAGDALSLAATRAAIQTYREENVVDHLWSKGERLFDGLNGLFEQHGLPLECDGFKCCPLIRMRDGAPPDTRDRFFRAAFGQGVSFYNVAYISFSHQDADIDEALERVDAGIKSL
ncbi:MAG: aminotransferase class III-fold pyridoxal phosphate-dependent enzyme [Planctomycetota bacterium]|nr:aminotransferase class III-fold pyridoxal phosphate-dependent enzyme [Planctomycetota bacterium]MDP7130339.1 aminotransferase class III-fold pyridoxal phosphate-dependent enzyme [Planctomycetota bacterium]MDP7250161.1 aminotransferase class III-fold pyridoxal phosphate-dependent enzyme [Planctomycetota bacterium]